MGLAFFTQSKDSKAIFSIDEFMFLSNLIFDLVDLWAIEFNNLATHTANQMGMVFMSIDMFISVVIFIEANFINQFTRIQKFKGAIDSGSGDINFMFSKRHLDIFDMEVIMSLEDPFEDLISFIGNFEIILFEVRMKDIFGFGYRSSIMDFFNGLINHSIYIYLDIIT